MRARPGTSDSSTVALGRAAVCSAFDAEGCGRYFQSAHAATPTTTSRMTHTSVAVWDDAARGSEEPASSEVVRLPGSVGAAMHSLPRRRNSSEDFVDQYRIPRRRRQ